MPPSGPKTRVGARRTAKPRPEGESSGLLPLFLMSAAIGILFLAGGGVYWFKRKVDRDERVKLVRGMVILDQLDDLACDYYYSGKNKENNGHLPDSAWEPFKKLAEAGDVFDCAIMNARGAEDETADALFYKEGKAQGGESLGYIYGAFMNYGPRGSGDNPEKGQVRVVNGFVKVGDVIRPVIFFRRAILHPKYNTSLYFGHAVVVLYKDVLSPDPGTGGMTVQPLPPAPAEPTTPAPAKDDAQKPAPSADSATAPKTTPEAKP